MVEPAIENRRRLPRPGSKPPPGGQRSTPDHPGGKTQARSKGGPFRHWEGYGSGEEPKAASGLPHRSWRMRRGLRARPVDGQSHGEPGARARRQRAFPPPSIRQPESDPKRTNNAFR
jgi:hypothetical protein